MGRPSHEADDMDKGGLALAPPVPPLRRPPSRVDGQHDEKEDPALSKPATIGEIPSKPDERVSQPKGSKPPASGHRNQSSGRNSDSFPDDDDSEDELEQPGAHRVRGYEATSSRSVISMVSAKTSEDNHGLQTAIPIDEDAEQAMSDTAKKEIQEAANLQVQLRIQRQVVHAQETTMEEIKKETMGTKRRRQCGMGLILIFVLLAGALATTIYFVTRGKVEPAAPTPAPTYLPPIFSPNNTDDLNDECFSAYSIQNVLGAAPIVGSTNNVTMEDDDSFIKKLDACEVVSKNGLGVWYKMTGNNSRMMASTCDETYFDTQISIFVGSCGGLKCIAGNDQMSCGNGDQSMVAWHAAANTEYFVYVHGHRSSRGIFHLEVNELEDNNECESAVTLDVSEEPIFGSTRGAQNDGTTNCGTARQSAAGVWYTIGGTGGIVSAALLTDGLTSFRGQVSVFKGNDCKKLECVDGSIIGYVNWLSVLDEKYYILVHGQSVLQGDFRLQVDTLRYGPPPIESGDPCPALQDATLLPIGSSGIDSTVDQPIFDVPSCGHLVFSTAGGSWFQTVGTGGPIRVSTCGSETDFDTQVSVFEGYCGDLRCVDGNDQAGDCDDGSSVSWFSDLGREYYILVHGYAEREGDFILSVEEVAIEISETCDSAISISTDGSSLLGVVDDTNVTIDLPYCGESFANRTGVWYQLEGTGEELVASTCEDGSFEPSTVTVFRGVCDSLQCVNSTMIPCGTQSSVSFENVEGEKYYLFVESTLPQTEFTRNLQGFEFEGGNLTSEIITNEGFFYDSAFKLTVEETPVNDNCETAIGPISPHDPAIFASTRSATTSGAESCNLELPNGRGVWYTVVGNGEEMTVSTCSNFTNFDAYANIYAGGCRELRCVETIESYCRSGWATRWQTSPGVTYHVFVSGIGLEEQGNFELSVGSGNDFCSAAQLLPDNGSVTIGSTSEATFDEDVPVCGGLVTSPGVWYYVFGTGAEMVVSTCHPDTEFETQISIYRGNCDNLRCEDSSDTGSCDSKSTVKWLSREGEFYYIHVHGYGVGNFAVSITGDNDLCPSATDLAPQLQRSSGGTQTSISGSIAEAPIVTEDACGFTEPSNGVWFFVEGRGSDITVNTCSEITSFNSRISIFTGNCDGNLICVETKDDTELCGAEITFQARIGERYYILVHGALSEDGGGGFELNVREQSPDSCQDAIALSARVGDLTNVLVDHYLVPFESFVSEETQQCGGAVNFGFGGHWYSVVGTGNVLSASLCEESNSLAGAQISIFNGVCEQLSCVDGSGSEVNEIPVGVDPEGQSDAPTELQFDPNVIEGPGCVVPSNDVSWLTLLGVEYFIHIHGSDFADGSYTLHVRETVLA